ncbi:hypothetical protein AAHH80_38805, partial [Burkholderia pseudomallei]
APTHPAAYPAVLATVRRIWSGTPLNDKMRRNQSGSADAQRTERKIDKALTRFRQKRRRSPLLILSTLTVGSPSWRHALR